MSIYPRRSGHLRSIPTAAAAARAEDAQGFWDEEYTPLPDDPRDASGAVPTAASDTSTERSR